jgi:hypothetical protein
VISLFLGINLSCLQGELGSSVVGIGWVRCGGALERSVLYKVLADRLGIPCSLHRAGSRAWCEIALPQLREVSVTTTLRYGTNRIAREGVQADCSLEWRVSEEI